MNTTRTQLIWISLLLIDDVMPFDGLTSSIHSTFELRDAEILAETCQSQINVEIGQDVFMFLNGKKYVPNFVSLIAFK